MARKRERSKRIRDALSTQEFFALPRSDDEEDEYDSEDDEDYDGPPCTCNYSGFGHWHGHEGEPNSWVASTSVPPAAMAWWQTRVDRVRADCGRMVEKEEKEEEGGGAVPERVDWREKADELVTVSSLIAADEESPKGLRLEARCSSVFGKALCVQEELNGLLCCAQTLNVDKTYAAEREREYGRIKREQGARHGGVADKRASASCANGLLVAKREKVAESSDKRGGDGEKAARRKMTKGGRELVDLMVNMTAALKEIRKIGRDVNDRPVRLPAHAPDDFTFHSQVVPGDLPRCVRGEIYDLDFIHHQVLHLKDAIFKLRDKVQQLLVIWSGCDDLTWHFGKKQVYKTPSAERYERLRLSLAASYIICRRTENHLYRDLKAHDLVDIFDEGWKLSLGISSLSTIRKVDWPRMLAIIKEEAYPLADMIGHCEESREVSGDGLDLASLDEHRQLVRAMESLFREGTGYLPDTVGDSSERH